MVKTRTYLLAVMLATYSHITVANNSTTANIADNSQAVIERGTAALKDDFLDKLITRKRDSELAVFSEDTNQSAVNDDMRFVILVSDDMGKSRLKSLISAFSNRNDVSLVIRGLLPQERTITDVGRRIMNYADGLKSLANVSLDPRYFDEIAAENVPVTMAYRGDSLIAYASGLANPKYLTEQIELGNTGDLGNFGSVVNISEKHMTDILMERAANLDKEKIIAQAKDDFWSNMRFVELPKATKNAVRYFEPKVVIQNDILSPKGDVIALRGDTFNTLKTMPFLMRVVIFDATDINQLNFVKSLPKSHLRTKFIASKFDVSLKNNAVKSIEQYIASPVCKLENDLIHAFNIKTVPSVITADNKINQFIIREYKVSEAAQ
ncbi:TrbC family F-type conjugative pilus assembly protein [Photobacterium leiognathi]|uniref:TrbC family F-type conjugative pilus assembly protein n=1 Tax=Photobacterium leiognathi TaxID=553611 RepID=UPI00273A2B17|nr:TrbC family F-type conjugative pilus assembly protein [Photobacterium leiognathi]